MAPYLRRPRIAIVGAGPAGIVCALALAKRGVRVTVFEQEPAPVRDQRAASIHPPTLEMLDEIGITQKIIDDGLISSKYRFHDRVSGDVVAEFDLDMMRDEFRFPFVLQYEQYKLTAMISGAYGDSENFDVRFSHKVVALEQNVDGVTLDIDTPAGIERFDFAYVIGCDGGRSAVRRLAGFNFEGFTYPEKFIKIATPFDIAEIWPHLVYRNYFSSPTEWCNLFKVRGEDGKGLWRAILPMRPDEDDVAAQEPANIQKRLQRLLPKAGSYPLAYVDVYSVSQLVADTFRRGRVLLAGDSAHVNNPIGGMGMNGGIHDAFNLADKLANVVAAGGDDAQLDVYARQRRHAAVSYVQAQTISNKRLLEEADPVVRQANLRNLRQIAENREMSHDYMRRASLLESLQSAAAVT